MAERLQPAFPESTRHGHTCDLNEPAAFRNTPRPPDRLEWGRIADRPVPTKTFPKLTGKFRSRSGRSAGRRITMCIFSKARQSRSILIRSPTCG